MIKAGSVEERRVGGLARGELECDEDLRGGASLRVHDIVEEVTVKVAHERLAVRLNRQRVRLHRPKLKLFLKRQRPCLLLPDSVDQFDVSAAA